MLFRIIILFLLPVFATGQSFQVKDIIITGNDKTRELVILREMDLAVGDIVPADKIQERLDFNTQQVLNTHLFTDVQMRLTDLDPLTRSIVIEIAVKESWYIYPMPKFDLADRNFNTWWNTHNRDIDRVNFGGSFYHLNFTGRRDRLKLLAQYGYTHKYELQYKLPYLDRSGNLGFSAKAFYSRNREIAYDLSGNQELFVRSEDRFLLERMYVNAALQYRQGLNKYYALNVSFNGNFVPSYLADSLNQDFFLHGRQSQRFFSVEFTYTRDYRDIRAYPIDGSYFEAALKKEGLGLFDDHNVLMLRASYSRFLPVTEKWSYVFKGKGQTNLYRRKVPFYNYRGLGFGEDYIRGYEYYVINGNSYVYFRNSIRFELLNHQWNLSKWMPFKNYKTMPVKIYLSLNGDTGYVRDPHYQNKNTLTNQWLWGGGPGLDILFYHDKLLRMEYSFNHLGENGLFLSFNYSIQ